VSWFRQQRTPENKILSYGDGIKRVLVFSSVESLWALTIHLAPPSVLAPTTDYLLFHAAVQRPMWEDPLNITGGRAWRTGCRRRSCVPCGGGVCGVWGGGRGGGAHGESLEDDDVAVGKNGTSGEDAGDTPEICECTISVRQSEDILSLWNRVDDARVRRD
jgi:translation initiation factor 4E